jgi:hypothetical protein
VRPNTDDTPAGERVAIPTSPTLLTQRIPEKTPDPALADVRFVNLRPEFPEVHCVISSLLAG